jgi:TonB family protein
MAHYPIPEPDSDRSEPSSDRADAPSASLSSSSGRLREVPRRAGETPEFESDLVELTAKFSSDEGGQLPAELSLDLALEVVLHEIVEQACAATGADGAAVILQRDGEWVCRASTGANAPALGARLSGESGLIAACIQTRQTQRCEDAMADARVDAQICRNLGIRSVIALPVIQNEALLGVFAAFSPRAGLFKEAVENALRVFSEYVLSSVAQAAQPVRIPQQAVTAAPIAHETSRPESSPAQDRKTEIEDEKISDASVGPSAAVGLAEPLAPGLGTGVNLLEVPEEKRAETPLQGAGAWRHRAIKVITWIMAAAVLGFAVLLTTIAGERLMGKASATHRHTANVPSHAAIPGNTATEISAAQPAADAAGDQTAPARNQSTLTDQGVLQGGLVVYDNGKEIFRENDGPTATARNHRVEAETAASGIEPAAMYELASATAEGRLLRRVEPAYPEAARSQGIQGKVVLQVLAGHGGAVEKVGLIQGDPVLAEAAIAAVKQWRFQPLVVSRRPVDMETTVTLNFKLPER